MSFNRPASLTITKADDLMTVVGSDACNWTTIFNNRIANSNFANKFDYIDCSESKNPLCDLTKKYPTVFKHNRTCQTGYNNDIHDVVNRCNNNTIGSNP